MDPPLYSGYSIFFGVIDDFHKKTLVPPPTATSFADMVEHPAAIVQVLSPTKLFLVAGGTGKDKKLVWKVSYPTPTPPNRKEWVEGGKVRKELEAYLEKLKCVVPPPLL